MKIACVCNKTVIECQLELITYYYISHIIIPLSTFARREKSRKNFAESQCGQRRCPEVDSKVNRSENRTKK